MILGVNLKSKRHQDVVHAQIIFRAPSSVRQGNNSCSETLLHITLKVREAVQKINSYIPSPSAFTCGPLPRAEPFCLPIAFPGCFEAILSDRMLPQMLVIMSAQSEIVKISQNWANRENKNLFGPGWGKKVRALAAFPFSFLTSQWEASTCA